MKAHLQKLEVVKTWAEFESADALRIVDWDACAKQNVPRGHKGCRTYSKDDVPGLLNGKPPHAVEITCSLPMDMVTIELKKNAWRKDFTGQCDAILFPASDVADDAVLFVEIKYSKSQDEKSLERCRRDARKQIEDTIQELRNRECPLEERTLYGLISFPLLRSEIFGASMFDPTEGRLNYSQNQMALFVSNRVTYTDSRTIRPA